MALEWVIDEGGVIATDFLAGIEGTVAVIGIAEKGSVSIVLEAEDDVDEYKRMPAAQRAKMMRARKRPKSGAKATKLRMRRKKAKKPGAKRKRARYAKKMKRRGGGRR